MGSQQLAIGLNELHCGHDAKTRKNHLHTPGHAINIMGPDGRSRQNS